MSIFSFMICCLDFQLVADQQTIKRQDPALTGQGFAAYTLKTVKAHQNFVLKLA